MIPQSSKETFVKGEFAITLVKEYGEVKEVVTVANAQSNSVFKSVKEMADYARFLLEMAAEIKTGQTSPGENL